MLEYSIHEGFRGLESYLGVFAIEHQETPFGNLFIFVSHNVRSENWIRIIDVLIAEGCVLQLIGERNRLVILLPILFKFLVLFNNISGLHSRCAHWDYAFFSSARMAKYGLIGIIFQPVITHTFFYGHVKVDLAVDRGRRIVCSLLLERLKLSHGRELQQGCLVIIK